MTDAAPTIATLRSMAKQSKKPADLNRLAAAIVDHATTEGPTAPESPRVQSGRKGGLKGGKARAERMTAEERTEAARRAANARWADRGAD